MRHLCYYFYLVVGVNEKKFIRKVSFNFDLDGVRVAKFYEGEPALEYYICNKCFLEPRKQFYFTDYYEFSPLHLGLCFERATHVNWTLDMALDAIRMHGKSNLHHIPESMRFQVECRVDDYKDDDFDIILF